LSLRRSLANLESVGSSDGELRVEPAVLAASCEALSSAAEHLLAQLKSLDGSVTSMLASWQGSSGGAYADAWKLWHQGADEVEQGLSTMAQLLGATGKAFEKQDGATAEELRGVYRG
jgi:WXG100 family type VII secretion target